MAKKRGGDLTPEQIVSSSSRDMEGTDYIQPRVQSDFEKAILRPRYTANAGDPALMTTSGRNQVINENLGASYKGIPAGLDRGTDPSVGPTQFSGRTLTSQISREGNFWDASKD